MVSLCWGIVLYCMNVVHSWVAESSKNANLPLKKMILENNKASGKFCNVHC